MGKSSFPTLLLRSYITAGASVTLERDTCWHNLWPRLLQQVPEKPIGLMQTERRSIYSGNLTGILILTFQMGCYECFCTYQRPCDITRARWPPQVIAHQPGSGGFTPEIHMSPCHACPCVTAAQPDIFMQCLFARIAVVPQEQRRHLHRDPVCQSQLLSRPTLNGTD